VASFNKSVFGLSVPATELMLLGDFLPFSGKFAKEFLTK